MVSDIDLYIAPMIFFFFLCFIAGARMGYIPFFSSSSFFFFHFFLLSIRSQAPLYAIRTIAMSREDDNALIM